MFNIIIYNIKYFHFFKFMVQIIVLILLLKLNRNNNSNLIMNFYFLVYFIYFDITFLNITIFFKK